MCFQSGVGAGCVYVKKYVGGGAMGFGNEATHKQCPEVQSGIKGGPLR